MIDTETMLEQILTHSEGLAAAADGNLAATVEHCPDWAVADLVAHVIEVHWFWETVARERIIERPNWLEEPPRPADAELIPTLRAGVQRLVATLRGSDQADHVWTWAPHEQNIAFITRHQVQEAAVHRFDAENAAGRDMTMIPAVAADSVDEFLAFSLEPGTAERLDGLLTMSATDVGREWVVGRSGSAWAQVSAPAFDLLLWLYRRVSISPDDGENAAAVIERFTGLTSTD